MCISQGNPNQLRSITLVFLVLRLDWIPGRSDRVLTSDLPVETHDCEFPATLIFQHLLRGLFRLFLGRVQARRSISIISLDNPGAVTAVVMCAARIHFRQGLRNGLPGRRGRHRNRGGRVPW